jgi:hypothetical protein
MTSATALRRALFPRRGSPAASAVFRWFATPGQPKTGHLSSGPRSITLYQACGYAYGFVTRGYGFRVRVDPRRDRLTGPTLITMRVRKARSAERWSASGPVPGALRVARVLFWIQSAAWMLLGTLLVVGGLIVLRGGSGLPGIVNDSVGDPPIGGWAVGSGIVITAIACWGIWTGWSMRRLTRGAHISALLFCGVWIVLGVLWMTIATTPIPGMVVIAVNAVILVGLIAGPRSRAGSYSANDQNTSTSKSPVDGSGSP